jgi:hypothetical protein
MFVKELCELQINTNNVVMASFDVKSLFTNILLDETISIIVNKCFYNTSRFHGFTVDQFTRLLNLSVKNCVIFYLMMLFISRLMVLQWVHHLVHCLLTSFYHSMKNLD